MAENEGKPTGADTAEAFGHQVASPIPESSSTSTESPTLSSPETRTSPGTSKGRSFFHEVDENSRKSEQQRAEQQELDRVRQQLGTVKKEFVQSKAQEAAKQQIAKETRALPWWRQAGQVIRSVPSFLREQKSTTNQLAQEYSKDYQRREEIKARLAATGLKESEEKQLYAELAQLEAKLAKGQGVELTEQDRQRFDELERIIATNRGELDLEDQRLKDRAETGPILEWLRAHPGWKTTGVVAAGGLLAASVLPIAGLFGIGAAAVKGGIVGATGGAMRREASVHDPRQWARETGLLFRDPQTGVERYRTDQELQSLSNQELSRAVGVIKNALEQGKVGGSRGEYLRVWTEYRRVNDLLAKRSEQAVQEIQLEDEQKGSDQARLREIRERIQGQMQATDDYDQLLRNALSEQEWQTYQSMQAGKGKQIYGAAIMGAGVGAAAGALLGFLTRHAPSMQDIIDKYYDDNRMQIIGQRRLAGAKIDELAERGVASLGLNPDKFDELVTGLANKVPSEKLIQEGFAGNIDLRIPVDGQSFVEWLKTHNDWFQGLPRNIQVEVISHPDLAPMLLQREGQEATARATTAGIMAVTLFLGSTEGRYDESGKDKITTALKGSADRYGQAGKSAWEAAKTEAKTKKDAEEAKQQEEERAQKEKIDAEEARAREEQKAKDEQLRDAAQWQERRRREDDEEKKKIEEKLQERIMLLQIGQRFELKIKERGARKSIRKEYRLNSMGRDPQTGERVAEMVANGDRRLVELVELVDPDMSTYQPKFVGFAPQEAKPAQQSTQQQTRKEQQPPTKLTEGQIGEVISEFALITDPKERKNIYSIRDRLMKQGILIRDPQSPKKFIVTHTRYQQIKSAMDAAFRRTKQKG